MIRNKLQPVLDDF